MKRTCACLAWLAMFQTCGVSAQDAGIYVSAAVGRADAPDRSQLGELTGSTDNDNWSWNVGLGYRFNPNIALELGYLDLGELESDLTDATGITNASAHASFGANGATFALVGTFPMGRWEPYLKAGVLFSSTELEFAGSNGSRPFAGRITNDNEDALYGAGVRFTITERLRVYLDITYLDEVGEPETGQSRYFNSSLGVLWRF